MKSDTNKYVLRKTNLLINIFTASPDKFVGDDGEARVSAEVNGHVLSAKLPQFPASCFKGLFKTTFEHFRLHKMTCLN